MEYFDTEEWKNYVDLIVKTTNIMIQKANLTLLVHREDVDMTLRAACLVQGIRSELGIELPTIENENEAKNELPAS